MGKKIYFKAPVIVIGWRKKSQTFFRDERLKPAYWKVRRWVTWIMMSICYPIGILVPHVIRDELDWIIIFIILGIGALGAIVSAVMRRKRLSEFYKLKNELGIEFERDGETIKKAISEASKAGTKTAKIACIMGTTIFAFLSLKSFLDGDLFFAIFFAVMVGFYLFLFIKQMLVSKKKVEQNENDSE